MLEERIEEILRLRAASAPATYSMFVIEMTGPQNAEGPRGPLIPSFALRPPLQPPWGP
jgi:hypothetical protein